MHKLLLQKKTVENWFYSTSQTGIYLEFSTLQTGISLEFSTLQTGISLEFSTIQTGISLEVLLRQRFKGYHH